MNTWTRPRVILLSTILVLIALYVVSPYWMLWRLQRAAERDDTAALQELIDFPAVRAALKTDAGTAMREKLSALMDNKLIAGWLGATVGPEIANRLIDEQITPAMAAHLIKGAKLDHARFTGLTQFQFEARGLKASASFRGLGWRVVWIGLSGK